MPRRRDKLTAPRTYLNGDWPLGVIPEDTPLAVSYMQRIAVAAQTRLDALHMTRRDLSDGQNLDRSTLRLVLNGYRWPDIVTLTKLEQGLGMTVWPTYYYDARPMRDKIAQAMHGRLPDCVHDEHGQQCVALADAAVMAL